MTEHSAVIFVFFFLAEYASIILICILNSILFLGGYLFDFNYYLYPYFYLVQFIAGDSYMYLTDNESNFNVIDFDNYSSIIGTTISGVVIGVKACIMVFVFVWARASFPRIRYDQLMSYCWTVLLPVVIAFIILVPCILYSFEIIPVNISLLSIPLVIKKDSLIKNTYKNTTEDLDSLDTHSVYNNLHEKDTLVTIRKDLTNVGGVYAIVHNVTKKLYIGSSINLARRIVDHINNQHSNVLLQNAINKYSLSNFSVYILELLPMDENLTSEELGATLIKMEQKHLDLFNDKYNINPNAGKTRLGAKHSEATKELMSKLRKENPSFLNKTHSSEVVEQLRARMEGSNNPMFGKPVTESNKKLISDLFRKYVYLYDANTLTLIAKYDKHKDLTDALEMSPKTLIKYKDSGEVFRGKYLISSIELPSNNI